MKNKSTLSQNKINELFQEEFISFDGSVLNINEINSGVILLFTSLYCIHCIDLLPELNEINNVMENSSLILFTDGKAHEIREMVEFFKWNFLVVNYDQDNLKTFFPDIKLPLMIALDENKILLTHGTIYNKTDFILSTKTAFHRV